MLVTFKTHPIRYPTKQLNQCFALLTCYFDYVLRRERIICACFCCERFCRKTAKLWS